MNQNPNENKVVLQINSIKVLERLLGGDGEVEVDLRNSIVHEFARRHLKPLANSHAIKELAEKAREACYGEANRLMVQYIGSFTQDGAYRQVIVLNDAMKKAIRDAVAEQKSALVKAEVEKAMAEWTPEAIQKVVDARVNADITQRIKDAVDAKLKSLREQI